MKLKDFINKNLKESLDNDWYDSFFWEYWAKKSDSELEEALVFTDPEGDICGWGVYADWMGMNILSIPYVKYGCDISNQIPPNTYVMTDMAEAGTLMDCDMSSSVPDQKFNIGGGQRLLTNGDINWPATQLNRYIWNKKNLNGIKFIDIPTAEIEKYLPPENLSTYTDSHDGKVPGFHYFQYGSDFHGNKGVRFLLAVDEDGTIAGVIRYGFWPYSGNVTCISYIDISYHAREKGLARLLIRELYKVIDHSIPFRIGHLSEMGKSAHIDKVFMEEMPGIKFVE